MSSERIRLTVPPADAGLRLEQFLRQHAPNLSRGALRRALAQHATIWVDRQLARKGQRLKPGQVIELATGALEPSPIPRGDLELDVIVTTDEFVVVNKPPGIASHPLSPGESDTLAGRLVHRFPECLRASPDPREAGLVHRLDRGTSGLIVAARTRNAYQELRSLFTAGQVDKRYLALATGSVTEPAEVAAEIEAVPGDRRRVRLVAADGGNSTTAITRYRPLLRLGPVTLIEASCHTGRRHQIRVHLASRGHPLVDDLLYGGPQLTAPPEVFLHAWVLQLGEQRYCAPLPPARQRLLHELAQAHGQSGARLPGCDAQDQQE